MKRRSIVWAVIIVLSLVAATVGPYYLLSKRLEALIVPVAVTPATPANETPVDVSAQTPTLYYSMTSYATRPTSRPYGTPVVPTDNQRFSCGDEFTGFHSGDDLEVTALEKASEVPVFSIAAGTVAEVSNVGGYGGLVVIQHTVEGQPITAYYGHIDLSQTKIKVGDVVTAGQVITYLGDDCSAETSGERKHLHFSIRSGSSVDVRGYIKTEADLANWLNPLEFLRRHNAAEPKV